MKQTYHISVLYQGVDSIPTNALRGSCELKHTRSKQSQSGSNKLGRTVSKGMTYL